MLPKASLIEIWGGGQAGQMDNGHGSQQQMRAVQAGQADCS